MARQPLAFVAAAALLGGCGIPEPAKPPRIEGPNGHEMVAVPGGTYRVGGEGSDRNLPRTAAIGSAPITCCGFWRAITTFTSSRWCTTMRNIGTLVRSRGSSRRPGRRG